MNAPSAFFDLGTNSTRFLLVEDNSGFQPRRVVARGARVTRLGEGISSTGYLSEPAMKRVTSVLEEFAAVVAERGGQWQAGVATSACRRADNSARFFARVQEITGVPPELISGEKEGALTCRGVKASLPEVVRGKIMDIGGGSTEWITFSSVSKSETVESLPVGVVSLKEKCLQEKNWNSPAVQCIKKELDRIFAPENYEPGPLVLVGGTGTTLSAYHQGLTEYRPEMVHGQPLTRTVLEDLEEELLNIPVKKLAEISLITPGRADVLLPGLQIILKTLEYLQLSRTIVSDFGILAGLADTVLKE